MKRHSFKSYNKIYKGEVEEGVCIPPPRVEYS